MLIGTPKGTIILTTTHIEAKRWQGRRLRAFEAKVLKCLGESRPDGPSQSFGVGDLGFRV